MGWKNDTKRAKQWVPQEIVWDKISKNFVRFVTETEFPEKRQEWELFEPMEVGGCSCEWIPTAGSACFHFSAQMLTETLTKEIK